MLKLTKKADYGLIALRHLAVNLSSGSASAKEIADRCGLPLPLLSKVLQKLARRGFLEALYGMNGGYRLARDPRQISTLEVILAIDGPVILASCFNERGECIQSPRCTVRAPLRKIHEGLLRLLGGTMISEMAEEAAPPAGEGELRVLSGYPPRLRAARTGGASLAAASGHDVCWKGAE